MKQMRYQPTNQPTDTASYRGALSHLKSHDHVSLSDSAYFKLKLKLKLKLMLKLKRISMGRGISSFPALSGNGKVIPELNCFFLVNKSKTNPRDKIVEICAHFMMLPKF